MKISVALILLMVIAAAWCGLAAAEEKTNGFVEFVESEIIPLVVEPGEGEGAVDGQAAAPPFFSEEPSSPAEENAAPAPRDPFWPAGYAPPPPRETPAAPIVSTSVEAEPSEPQWDEALKAVAVQGIMKTGPDSYVAMVNGQVVGKGDGIAIRFQGRAYRWQVAAVSAAGVSFSRLKEDRLTLP